ncbi:MAG: TIGR02588 family protein [Chloroflexota bacterium]|nr:TIGR02588 family protein [Chloroflexota bacterium]
MSKGKTQSPWRTSDQERPRGHEDWPNGQQQGQAQGQQSQQQQSSTLAEWIATGISALILLGVAGFVLYLWFVAPNNEPVIHVTQAGEIRAVGEQWYVPFEIHNSGDREVTAVAAKADLVVNSQVVEQGQVHFDWLSGGETERGMFVFSNDPASGELKLSVGSFKIP